VVRSCGCSIIGQTRRLAPADRKLYALRDVTGTVPSIPLIASSILSKKLAEGLDALVLDVKCGRGAFMKHVREARALAHALVETGRAMGCKVAAILTDMDQPLGRTAGNILEVRETLQALRGECASDLSEVTLVLGAHALALSGVAGTPEEARDRLAARMAAGEGWARFREMVRCHGGDVTYLDDPDRFPVAAHRETLAAARSGWVASIDAERVGRACVLLGAGRRRTEDRIDPAVGVSDLAKAGDRVATGDTLLTVHASSRAALNEALALLRGGVQITDRRVAAPPRILGVTYSPGGCAT
jgi:pyrimidine-nucleoside phosphorylase